MADESVEAAVVPSSVRVASPWARLWSRLFDVGLYQLPFTLALAALGAAMGPNGAADVNGLDAILSAPSLLYAMVADALVFRLFGVTPGRLIAGLRVETEDGRRPSGRLYLRRNMGVYVFGMYLGVPLLDLLGLLFAYRQVRRMGVSSWDRRLHTRVAVRGGAAWRTALVATLYVVMQLGAGLLPYVLAAGSAGPRA